jgi:lysyl-tRNA synthetase class 2
MADAEASSLAQDTANLHLDEVTGERVSKSELKKRQKQRQVEAKKKEKAAAAPPKPEKKAASAELDESNLNPNVSPPTRTCSSALNSGN